MNHHSLQVEDLKKGEADSQDRNQNIAEWSKNKFKIIEKVRAKIMKSIMTNHNKSHLLESNLENLNIH